jgi:hypothetical protein
MIVAIKNPGTRINSKPVMVARTKTRDRCDVDAGAFWHEYRVRRRRPGEHDENLPGGRRTEFRLGDRVVLERRRVDTLNGVVVVREDHPEWVNWDFCAAGKSLVGVLDEWAGDSSFREADSLVPEHAMVTRHTRDLRAASGVAYEAGRDLAAMRLELARFCDRENRKYQDQIAGKDAAASEKVKARITKRVGPHLEYLKAEVVKCEAQFESANKALAEVKARKLTLSTYPPEIPA